MPIFLPTAEAVRQAIGARAADALGVATDSVLDRIGPVIPAEPLSFQESAWRVAHFCGTHDELRAIEQAASEVRRKTPFIAIRP